jgi:GT2 family glycosyltransferase
VKFSVVLVNYQSWPLTLRCVESLSRTGYGDFEVVVVDNEGGKAPELPCGARLIQNPANLGFARACNVGIAESNGEFVVLINPDTTVGESFFTALESFLKRSPETGVAGPKVLDADGTVQLSARQEVGAVSGILGRTSVLTRLFPDSAIVRRLFPAADSPAGPTEVDWVSGACMALRSRMLQEIGGLDTRFFMYFEDADLCRRARAAGWKVSYLPEVTVTHEAGGSTADKPRALWRLHKSAFLYHRKHGRHGPLQLYSLVVLVGLAFRASAKLAVSLADRLRLLA